MKDFSTILARVMLYGTAIAAFLIAAGLAWYLFTHIGEAPGDHLFSGEPKYFCDPIDMIQRAFDIHEDGHRRSLIMIGIVVLLLNPPVRVALAAVGFALEKDRAYTIISAIVLSVLIVSFFW